MSRKMVACSNCGLETAAGRFCRFCGTPLDDTAENQALKHPKDSDPDDVCVEQTPDHESAMDAFHHRIEFDAVIEQINNDSLTLLLARSELSVIEQELDNLLDRIHATKQALFLPHADKKLLAERTAELREDFERTKQRKSNLEEVKGMTSLEFISQNLEVQKSQLSRLKESEETIDSKSYNEQYEATREMIRHLKKDLKSARKSSRDWLKDMKTCIQELEKDLSRLEASLKIGGINERSYRESKRRIERNLNILDGAYRALEEIVNKVDAK